TPIGYDVAAGLLGPHRAGLRTLAGAVERESGQRAGDSVGVRLDCADAGPLGLADLRQEMVERHASQTALVPIHVQGELTRADPRTSRTIPNLSPEVRFSGFPVGASLRLDGCEVAGCQ